MKYVLDLTEGPEKISYSKFSLLLETLFKRDLNGFSDNETGRYLSGTIHLSLLDLAMDSSISDQNVLFWAKVNKGKKDKRKINFLIVINI